MRCNNYSWVIQQALEMPGFYGQDELESLWDCLMAISDGSTVVEIGVWCGKTASLILEASKIKSLVVHLIDPFVHEGDRAMGEFTRMIRSKFSFLEPPYGIPFTLHVRSSSDPVFHGMQNISLLHVDGNHDYPGPQNDCKNWIPRLSSDSYAVFHDYQRLVPGGTEQIFPAVSEAVDSIVRARVMTPVRIVDSQIVLKWRCI